MCGLIPESNMEIWFYSGRHSLRWHSVPNLLGIFVLCVVLRPKVTWKFVSILEGIRWRWRTIANLLYTFICLVTYVWSLKWNFGIILENTHWRWHYRQCAVQLHIMCGLSLEQCRKPCVEIWLYSEKYQLIRDDKRQSFAIMSIYIYIYIYIYNICSLCCRRCWIVGVQCNTLFLLSQFQFLPEASHLFTASLWMVHLGSSCKEI